MRILIVGGAGSAPFLLQIADLLDPSDELTVITPIVRDGWFNGLKSSPDLDDLLGHSPDPATHRLADDLIDLGYAPPWRRPADRVMTQQVLRTELLGAGFSLTDATLAMASRRGLPYRLLPISDDRAELHAVVAGSDGPHAIHIDEALGDPAAHEVQDVLLVTDGWSVSSSARHAVSSADVVVLGPSSRTLVIDPVLRTPGLLDEIPADRPVLVVDHTEDAPGALVAAAGLGAPDPGIPQPIAPDAAGVIARARELSA